MVHQCHLDYPNPISKRYTKQNSFSYKFFQVITIAKSNPLTVRNFFSRSAVEKEVARHVTSKYFYIIHPYSSFRFYWNSFIMVVHYIHLLYITFLMTFIRIKTDKITLIGSTVLCSITLLDVLINCFTGVVGATGNIIYLNHMTILLNYLRGYFIIEFLSSIPFDVLLCSFFFFINCNTHESHYHCILYIGNIKIFLISKILKYLKNCADMYNMDEVRFRILHLSLLTIMVTHLITCIYLEIISCFSVDKESTTEGIHTLNDTLSATEKYLKSIYYITAALYGSNMVAFPNVQIIVYSHILIIFSYSYILYCVVQIMQILKLKTSSKIKYDEIINQVQQYMKHKQLPIKMQQRLLLFYLRRYRGYFFNESAIVKSLSEPLRRDIILHCGKLFIEQVAIFQDISREDLSQIVACLKKEAYLPNDTIIKAGSYGDCMYFLSRGTATVLTPTGREVCHLEDGAHFGEIALIVKDRKRVANVIAIEFCDIYRLDKKDFQIYIPPQSNIFLKIEKIAMERLEKTHLMEEQHKERLYNNTLIYA